MISRFMSKPPKYRCLECNIVMVLTMAFVDHGGCSWVSVIAGLVSIIIRFSGVVVSFNVTFRLASTMKESYYDHVKNKLPCSLDEVNNPSADGTRKH